MTVFFYTIASAAFISVLSFSGALLLLAKDRFLRNLTIFLVALAAATLLGTAFLHFLPEALEAELPERAFLFPLIGFVLFYVGEKLLHLHHATQRDTGHDPRELGILSLAGDFVHNFIDGIILVVAFLVDVKLGFITAAAIALHEIPEEIAEFGVLLYAGFSKLRALLLNFLSASSILLGVIAGFVVQDALIPRIPFVLLFAVGVFLYIGASDFVPEFRKERDPAKTVALFLVFLGGLLALWLFTFLE